MTNSNRLSLGERSLPWSLKLYPRPVSWCRESGHYLVVPGNGMPRGIRLAPPGNWDTKSIIHPWGRALS